MYIAEYITEKQCSADIFTTTGHIDRSCGVTPPPCAVTFSWWGDCVPH